MNSFFENLKNISPHIKFTMEFQKEKSLYFWDVLISRQPNDTLNIKVYRNNTYTDIYLHIKTKRNIKALSKPHKTLKNIFRTTKETYDPMLV